jgi:hypothetical protein
MKHEHHKMPGSALPRGLKTRLWNCRPHRATPDPDRPYYFARWQDNLISGVDPEWVAAQLRGGSGQELAGKFRAIHSSSALAANTFGFFKGREDLLTVVGHRDFTSVQLERKCPTGLRGTPPNLDVFLEACPSILAIESKFLEYLSPKRPHFSEAYDRERFPAAEDPWWEYVEQAKAGDLPARELDVAQLVKHYLGLINLHDASERPVTLLYLFWEPQNWRGVQPFEKHRQQVADFAERVGHTSVTFRYLSYPDLWSQWDTVPALTEHVAALRARYGI